MKVLVFTTGLNLFFLLSYRFFESQLPDFLGHRRFWILIVLVLLPLLAIFTKKEQSREKATGIQISILSCIICVLFLELTFRLAPTLFPENLQHLVETGVSTVEERQNSVELLPYNPYAKPKANTRVHIPGYYGPKENFVYEWITDKRGFKNTPEVASKDQMDFVFLGDSFTEGMGVNTEDTFASQLSKKGFSAYSLGVQGYAPFQFEGIYEHYARPLKPRYVVIGYLNAISFRNEFFLKSEKEILEAKQFPSAIGRLVDRDNMVDKKTLILETDEGYQVPVMPSSRHRFAISALFSLTSHILVFKKNFDIKGGVANPERDPRFMNDVLDPEISLKLMSRYKGDIKNAENFMIEDVPKYSQAEIWKLTQKTFSKIIKMAREDGSKVLLVFFPDRGTAYYTKATSKQKKPNMQGLVEANLMLDFANKEKIDFLDLTPAFEYYVQTLTENSSVDQYPYLKIDGHPSRKGHELIANELEKFFKSKK